MEDTRATSKVPLWKQPWLAPGEAPLWADRGLVLVLACALFLPFAGSFGLWDPWETHYGEVARQITEREDWISTWWGSHWKNPAGQQEGSYFFSKPILLMWMMALGLEVFGFSEWGIRLGVALVAIAGVVAAYSAGQQVYGRRAGWLMALVLMTSPFFAMLGRQAQTDMPYVGTMTVALCFFLMAIFGRDREQPATRLQGLLTGAMVALFALPQWVLVATALPWSAAASNPAVAFFYYGPTEAALYALCTVGALASMVLGKASVTRRQLWLVGFYVFAALATMAKGLLGFALPGAFIASYLLLSGEWRRLKEMEIPRGIGVFIGVGFPWYVAMLVKHGDAFFQRFFIHDHFKRLATGVHQIDSGSFEHYVKWMGYGLWPWVAFLPAALVRLFQGHGLSERTDRSRATLMIFLWLAFTFTLFTLSSTKFHHYIFPAVPAGAFLIALTLEDLVARAPSRRLSWILYASVLGLVAFLGWDLVEDPRHLKNLFTYKYDRAWGESWNPAFRAWTGAALGLSLLGTGLVAAAKLKLRRAGVGALLLGAGVMATFCLDVYMPTISSDWSQKPVWDEYYRRCTRTEGPPGHDEKKRFCAEQSVSYKLNWRGETYYTQNEVIPITTDEDFNHFLKQNKDRPFYAIMDQNRFQSEFVRKLPPAFGGKACKIDVGSIKFALAHAPCDPDTGKTLSVPVAPAAKP
jgi:4-amino-4-deoxy-L-arabinose transferase-like glycosyltransferase